MNDVDFEKSEARNIAARNESLYRHNGELLQRITELESAIREYREDLTRAQFGGHVGIHFAHHLDHAAFNKLMSMVQEND